MPCFWYACLVDDITDHATAIIMVLMLMLVLMDATSCDSDSSSGYFLFRTKILGLEFPDLSWWTGDVGD